MWSKPLITLPSLLLTALTGVGFAQHVPRVASTDSLPSYRLETLVVTATRTETPLREVGSAVTVITADEINRAGAVTAADLLRSAPGADVVQTGGPGQITSLFLRGGNPEHTLVMLDGVELNDPITTARFYDFSILHLDQVERVEILRGPQSTLYGSDAISGVIHIMTRKGSGPPRFSVSTRSGTYGLLSSGVSTSGGTDHYDYAASAGFFRTGGFSAASERAGNVEKDGYRNLSFSGRFGTRLSPRVSFDMMVRHQTGRAEIDNFSGAGGDDPNRRLNTRQTFVHPSMTVSLWDHRWKQTLAYGGGYYHRADTNSIDSDHPDDWLNSVFKGRQHTFTWQNTLLLHNRVTLLFGIDTEQEKGASSFRSFSAFGPFESVFPERSGRLTGYYIQNQMNFQGLLAFTSGVRVDRHTRFGTHVTYRLAPALYMEKTGSILRASYGTGFKAPSLYQLYSDFGNPSLKPGESAGWDIGVEQYGWQDRLSAGITYFETDMTSMVDFDNSVFRYENIFSARSRGVEGFGRLEPFSHVRIGGSYTFTDVKDRTTRLRLLRRPRHKGWFEVTGSPDSSIRMHFGMRFTGERDDNDFSVFPATRVTLPSCAVASLTLSWEPAPALRITGKIDNLLGKRYEEALGYTTAGRAFYIGLDWSR